MRLPELLVILEAAACLRTERPLHSINVVWYPRTVRMVPGGWWEVIFSVDLKLFTHLRMVLRFYTFP